MGEILKQSPELALEFGSILFSYLDHSGNYIEHEILQRGVLWGIGTYLERAPQEITHSLQNQIHDHLHSKDPVKRAYAIRALINAGCFSCRHIPEHILEDTHCVDIFTGWNFVSTRISDMAHACTLEKATA
jgi:hypothetical protein